MTGTQAGKDFKNTGLNQVRDIFVFFCYTGLAYVHVNKLNRKDIVDGYGGEKWLVINRQKTDSQSRIPLLRPEDQMWNYLCPGIDLMDCPRLAAASALFITIKMANGTSWRVVLRLAITPYVLGRSGITSFSPFSVTNPGSPLPITLLSRFDKGGQYGPSELVDNLEFDGLDNPVVFPNPVSDKLFVQDFTKVSSCTSWT